MPLVVDLARPATRPTTSQYVNILQSAVEAFLPSKKNLDDAAFIAALAAQTFPLADDRKHVTGHDAIAMGSNLITDTYVSWTISGDISDGTTVYDFDGTTGTQAAPVVASMSQALSADPEEGDEVRVSFTFEMLSGNGLQVQIKDAGIVYDLDGVVGGHYPASGVQGPSIHVYSKVMPRDLTTATIVISDLVGNLVGQLDAPVVALRKQSL